MKAKTTCWLIKKPLIKSKKSVSCKVVAILLKYLRYHACFPSCCLQMQPWNRLSAVASAFKYSSGSFGKTRTRRRPGILSFSGLTLTRLLLTNTSLQITRWELCDKRMMGSRRTGRINNSLELWCVQTGSHVLPEWVVTEQISLWTFVSLQVSF